MKKLLGIAILTLLSSVLCAQTNPDIALVKASIPKVVEIEVHGVTDGYESYDSTFTTKVPVAWVGSGSLISADGMILSCDHLFERKLEERLILVKMNSGKVYRALLLAEDAKTDLSLLKIFPLHALPYFMLGEPVVRGQRVFAFGAPLEYDKTVSVGYVENVDVKTHDDLKTKKTLHGAALNPGNSGGPLVTEDGSLVGVNVSVLLMNPFMKAEAMGLAVRLHDIKVFLRD